MPSSYNLKKTIVFANGIRVAVVRSPARGSGKAIGEQDVVLASVTNKDNKEDRKRENECSIAGRKTLTEASH